MKKLTEQEPEALIKEFDLDAVIIIGLKEARGKRKASMDLVRAVKDAQMIEPCKFIESTLEYALHLRLGDYRRVEYKV